MNIHQLSVRYVREEDRILVLVNSTDGDELTLWLTRRLALGFWPLLNKVIADHAVPVESLARFPVADAIDKQMIVEFQRTETLEKSDFRTPYKNASDKPVLGPQPLLVTDVRLKWLANGFLQIEFLEKAPQREGVAEKNDTAPEPRGSHLTLDAQLTHGFVHLLSLALATSHWGQGGEALLSQPVLPNAQAVPLDKQKYLN